MVGSSRRRTSGEYPAAAPITVATATPMPKPAATRASVTSVLRCNSPVRARSTKVAKITDGGGARRPVAQPMRTTNSHSTASVTGNTRPSAGRAQRDQRCDAAGCAGAAAFDVPSAATVMATRDMGPAVNAMRQNGALDRDVAVVDQIVQRLFHVHVWRDDAGFLQRQPGFQNGVALWRPDLVEGQFGPLFKLNVDDRVGQFGDVHEDALFIVVMSETIFARLFIDSEHAFGQLRIGFKEVLAGIEDPPGVSVLVAIKQPRAVLDLRLRHHRIEAGPGIDVAANQRGLAVGMLQQHFADVFF